MSDFSSVEDSITKTRTAPYRTLLYCGVYNENPNGTRTELVLRSGFVRVLSNRKAPEQGAVWWAMPISSIARSRRTDHKKNSPSGYGRDKLPRRCSVPTVGWSH